MAVIHYGVLFILLGIISWDGVLTQIGWKSSFPICDPKDLTASSGSQRESRCMTPDLKRGVCIFVHYCQPLLSLVRENNWNREVINFLQQSNCGYDGGTPKVCCPLSTQEQTPSPTPPPTQTPPPVRGPFETSVVDVSSHPRLRSLLPGTCGISDLADKITNGEEAGLFEFPWMAALGYSSRNSAVDFLCGGSLINKRYVITAAHCLTRLGNRRLILVRLGEYDLKTENDCEGYQCAPPVQDIVVERVIAHERYSVSDKRHDIGLIRLSQDVVFNQAVRPICLPIGREEQTNLLNGRNVVVAGWGKTEYSSMSSVLLKVSLPVVPVKKCAEIFSGVARIVPMQICAGGKGGRDSCNGDSGGPLQSTGFRSGEPVFIQYGVLSFGPRTCGSENLPGVYTRVGHYMQWILDNMDS